MWALVVQNFRHVLRTRLLFFLFLFSFLIQFVGVKALHSVTLNFQGIISKLDNKDSLFIALLFQIFTGGYLAAAYGIWMIPYAHQGLRGPLTFSLPISKWLFPISYALSITFLLILQHGILLICYGLNFGWAIFASPQFPWEGFLAGAGIEILAFLVCTFGFATAAMAIGQLPAFFMGAAVLFLLQVGGAVLRLNLPSLDTAKQIYELLPPVGELVYDLRLTYTGAGIESRHLLLWAIWLGFFVLLFRFQLRYPAKIRGGES